MKPLRILGLAALVVLGGLLSFRVHGLPQRAAAVPDRTPRATVDPITQPAPVAGSLAALEERLRKSPGDPDVGARLGIAYLQLARETNDAAAYGRADQLLRSTLERAPDSLDATLGAGSLALARHRFREALRLGRRGLALTGGYSAPALGVVGDAQLELGRYREAFATFERMGALRPGLAAYARQSYEQELRGDLDAAILLMREAVRAGAGATENTNWARAQLGLLELKAGQIDAAEATFRAALAVQPSYGRAEAGLGAVAVARGDLDAAERAYARAAAHLPLPEIVAGYGDVQMARGDLRGARDSYALVRYELDQYAAAGGDADLERAAFDAAHPEGVDPAATVALARRALAARPSIHAHDALAWALYRAGDCAAARRESRAALALGSVDPLLRYHAAAIAACDGRRSEARRQLRTLLARTPRFHPLEAEAARSLLATLEEVRP